MEGFHKVQGIQNKRPDAYEADTQVPDTHFLAEGLRMPQLRQVKEDSSAREERKEETP
jgi:hypothetical protein